MDGADGYRVYVSDAPFSARVEATFYEDDAQPFRFIGAVAGQEYYFRVSAVMGDVESDLSSQVSSAVALPVNVTAPENVLALAGDTLITVTWTNVEGADGYRVYVSDVPFSMRAEATLYEDDAQPFRFTEAVVGQEYYFRVSAVVDDVESDLSSLVSSAVALPVSVAAPENVVALAGDALITVAWTNVEGADGYRVYVSDAPFSTRVEATFYEDDAQPFIFTDAVAGQEYYFRVSAVMGDVESELSSEISARVDSLVNLTAPENVIADAHNGRIIVSWTDVENAESYNIYVSDRNILSASAAGVSQYTDNEQPLFISDLERDRIYYIAVSAQDGDVESEISESAEVVLYRENDIDVFDTAYGDTGNFEINSDGSKSVFTGTPLSQFDSAENNSSERLIGVYLFDNNVNTLVPIVETTDITVAQELKISGNGESIIFTHSSPQIPSAIPNAAGNRNQLYFYQMSDGSIHNLETQGSPRGISVSNDGRLIAFHHSSQLPTSVVRFNNGTFSTVYEGEAVLRLPPDNRTVFLSSMIKISGNGQYLLYQGTKISADSSDEQIPVVIRVDIISGDVLEVGDGYSYDISEDGNTIIAGAEEEVIIYSVGSGSAEHILDYRFQSGIASSFSLPKLHETTFITDDGRFVILSGGHIDARDENTLLSRQLFDRSFGDFIEFEYNIDRISGNGDVLLGIGYAPTGFGSVDSYSYILPRPR